MGKLSSILLGTVSGVSAALFLTSDKGKQVRSQAQEFLEDLKEDPEYAKEQVCEKLTDVKEQTKEFVLKTKDQIESGKLLLTLSWIKQNIMLNKRLKLQKKP